MTTDVIIEPRLDVRTSDGEDETFSSLPTPVPQRSRGRRVIIKRKATGFYERTNDSIVFRETRFSQHCKILVSLFSFEKIILRMSSFPLFKL